MIYILIYFVAGYGTVVQPASINIVFGCKQAQQLVEHIIWVYLSSQLVHKMLNRIGCTSISLLH